MPYLRRGEQTTEKLYSQFKTILADHSPEHLLTQIKLSELRGRGGAGFPLATKLQTVRDSGNNVDNKDQKKYLVVNFDEGDAGAYIDKELVERCPALLLCGALLAAYACGASKWQTIQRIVLPRALPGIMTGAILAMARGAGEVAPLMLVGAVKLAPDLPVDGIFPYLHPERSFMHLGFHIFDLGFQSQNSEAAKPMVFTTTLLLIVIITVLNLSAIWLRTRLRRKYVSSHF